MQASYDKTRGSQPYVTKETSHTVNPSPNLKIKEQKFRKRVSSGEYDKIVVKYAKEAPKLPAGQTEDLLESFIVEERDISEDSLDKLDDESRKESLQSINQSEVSKEGRKIKLIVKQKQFKPVDKLMKHPKYRKVLLKNEHSHGL